MIEQLALVIIGIVIGSVLGVEYSLWRFGRKLRFIKEFVGFNTREYESLTLEGKRRYIGELLKETFNNLFPTEKLIMPAPNHVVSLGGVEYFVPTCPECGMAGKPVPRESGKSVVVVCPKHGVFQVTIPEKEKEE